MLVAAFQKDQDFVEDHVCVCACVCVLVSRVQLFATSWTVAHQAPLSMGFSRQEYCSGLPCTPPGHPPNLGIEPVSPALQVDSSPSELPGNPGICIVVYENKNN